MSTSSGSKPGFKPAYVPTTALARAVDFSDAMMRVTLTDGRIVSVPLVWFPRLQGARPEQQARYEISGGGVSLYWPDLDEDISIASILRGEKAPGAKAS